MIDSKFMKLLHSKAEAPKYEGTPELIAIHEASHAVMQIFSGNVLPSKTRINAVDLTGKAEHIQTVKPNEPRELEELPIEAQHKGACLLAAVYQSGLIGERIHLGIDIDGYVNVDCHDLNISAKVLNMVGLDPLNKYPDLLAKSVLKKHWTLVQSIAKKLLEDGFIDWAEIPDDAMAGLMQ